MGFWPSHLKVGNDLLVYAFRIPNGSEYFTYICSRTALVEESQDFDALGPGEPQSLNDCEQTRARLVTWVVMGLVGFFAALYLYWFMSKKIFQA